MSLVTFRVVVTSVVEVVLTPLPTVTYRTIGGVLDFYIVLGDHAEDVTRKYIDVSRVVNISCMLYINLLCCLVFHAVCLNFVMHPATYMMTNRFCSYGANDPKR